MFEAEHGAGVAGGNSAFFEVPLEFLCELKESQGVGNGWATFTDALSDFVLRKAEGVDKRLVSARLFQRGEIFALQVFDQGALEDVLLTERFKDDGWYVGETGKLGSTPATLAGDQNIAAFYRDHGYGLQNTVLLDGARKFLKCSRIKVLSRLIGVATYA
jgi:hypothetical protein